MKPVFIIAGTKEEYQICKGHLKIGRAKHFTEPDQIEVVTPFILVKTGTWFKNNELVKLTGYAEAVLEEQEAVREAQEVEATREAEEHDKRIAELEREE